ncbi:MAG TPA: hypothetical protein VI168_01765 [Croceibacterium sp.]
MLEQANHEVQSGLIEMALEASDQNRREAVCLLLDAAGAIILDATIHAGIVADETAQRAAKYLIEQIARNRGGRA